jgi:Mg-chelatase subunit ChlD
MSWSSERQLLYGSAVLGGAALIAGISLFFFFYEAPSCFDGRQNQSERGVDCGGSCVKICTSDVAPLVVRWSRAFEIYPGVYNAVAYVENPNRDVGVRSIGFRFDFFSEDNNLIAEYEGRTRIAAGGVTPVFVSRIETEAQVPARTFFEFTGDPEWFRAESLVSRVAIDNKVLSRVDSAPRLDTTIRNNTPTEEFTDIDVTAVIFGTDGNAIAASQTLVPVLSPRASEDLVFTWPEPFGARVESCIRPADIALLIDTSGSMNDDGGNPPEPISSAKEAAQGFVSRLSSDDRVTIISFASGARLEHPLSSRHSTVEEAVAELSILPEEEAGSTNIGEGITRAIAEFSNAPRAGEDARGFKQVIVLLTDGRANAPLDPGGELFALERAEEAQANGVVFYTIGLGDDVNQDFLFSIASNPDYHHQAVRADDLDGVYRSISESVCERGPAVIDVIPVSTDTFVTE